MSTSWRITVAPAGFSFEAASGMALMEAARRAGILLPASCRNGTCRTCMCRAKGKARHLIEWPGLSLEEKQEGYVLPCVATAESDLVLEAPGARLEGPKPVSSG
ncbi:MAG TPA: 2Fe-2S iron-sulfur cluster-binding protein [Noviherbaspirillum sp.]